MQLALAELHRAVLVAGRQLGRPVGIGGIRLEGRRAESLRGRDAELGRPLADEHGVVNVLDQRIDHLLGHHQIAAQGIVLRLQGAQFIRLQRVPAEREEADAGIAVLLAAARSAALIVAAGLAGGAPAPLAPQGRLRDLPLGLDKLLLALDLTADLFLLGEQFLVLAVFLGRQSALLGIRLVEDFAGIVDHLAALFAQRLEFLTHRHFSWRVPWQRTP